MSKVALVTGGTSGIGLAVAKKYLSKGYSVVAASVDRTEVVEAALAELSPLGPVIAVHCNVANVEDCRAAVQTTLDTYDSIDVLANVAGVTGRRTSFLDADLSDIANTININLMGSINMAQSVAKVMVGQHAGVIINVGSICGFIANSETIGYHASKGGVKMFTQALARELSPQGVRVFSVAPGWVKTAMVDDDTVKLGATFHMRGDRIISPEEVANVIYLLSLEEAVAVNGTTVMVDDGYSAFKGLF
ncbi:SDR family NAD(P)-dependent oxidoreductase [Alloscardovia criceti]|uniref:SDR family NAD(P)-dependent oxidoreductase n=1 Tax=Alloscardovia criceti TaxID=356828 RepID=UPI0003814C37|nr:SDR family oxidoreductase [Alloscardovia criceti]